MNREEQLAHCNKCLNKRNGPNKEIVCSLTQKPASFKYECPEFKVANYIKEEQFKDISKGQRKAILLQLYPEIIEELRTEQDLKSGLLVGCLIGFLGVILWTTVTINTSFDFGYMAVIIGVAVGLGIQRYGKAIDTMFGYFGVGITLFSCLFGSFLCSIGLAAKTEGYNYLETILSMDYVAMQITMIESFTPVDSVFIGIALFSSYQFSFRNINEKDIKVKQGRLT